MIPFALLTASVLLAQTPPEAPKKPRQVEVKGTLSSPALPSKMGGRNDSWSVSNDFVPGKTQYKIFLKPSKSLIAEIKSARPTFEVTIIDPKNPGKPSDAMPQTMDPRKDHAIFLNRQKKSMEIVVQVKTTESVASEPFTLVLTEIETDEYLKERENSQKTESKPSAAPAISK